MSHAIDSQPIDTLADLLERLGSIPLARILFHPFPGTATERDVAAEQSRSARLCELVDGVLVEKPMGFYEARVATCIARLLEEYADRYDLGFAVGADGAVRLMSGLVRIPDVSFFLWNRFPDRELPSEPVPSLAPDLAVEVLSENNTPQEMERKRREYFLAGVRAVWEIDARTRTARVYSSPEQFATVGETDVLEAGDFLPGFRLELAEIFRRAGRRAGGI